MKKALSILMALMILFFSQCKKPINGNDGTSRKVKVVCSIPIGNRDRSDFGNLLENSSVKWSKGTEIVYLAIPNENPQIIKCTASSESVVNELTFVGEVDADLLEEGKEYDIWYFGNSHQLDVPNYSVNGTTSIEGSVATQTGSIDDLGYCHIAKTIVTAVVEEDLIRLPLRGMMKSQIAIAYLDLDGVTKLSGSAIKGTEYKLKYNENTNEFDFIVADNASAAIEVTDGTANSFVVLLPNESDNIMLKSSKGGHEFEKGIKGNKFYYRNISDTEKGPLSWNEIEEENTINGHEYVDLGLSSGLLWATCNVGAETPEESGNYYAWGETMTKDTYTQANSITYSKIMNDISGNIQYDVATANWGGEWRMPTNDELNELKNNCTWTWMTNNGVNGYKVESKTNDNYIFLPAAGYRNGASYSGAGNTGCYWSSSTVSQISTSYCLSFNNKNNNVTAMNRVCGLLVRPVYGGAFDGTAAQYAYVETGEVTEITCNFAVCGGNVTTDNGYTITARGVCWSTTKNPTVDKDSKTTDGADVGSFTSNMTDLLPNTKYYVRAYVTNEAGTTYGVQKSFTTIREYVDLGLSVKWATCNIGAETPYEYGGYYAWGEITTKTEYPESGASTSGIQLNEFSGNAQYDAATSNWGADWRMPTVVELEELKDNCTWTKTTMNGVAGYKVTSKKNNNYIFLPAAGYYVDSSLYEDGTYGGYWSSTDTGTYPFNANYLYFNEVKLVMNTYSRGRGRSVRAVIE